jgi:hypothetical protein
VGNTAEALLEAGEKIAQEEKFRDIVQPLAITTMTNYSR